MVNECQKEAREKGMHQEPPSFEEFSAVVNELMENGKRADLDRIYNMSLIFFFQAEDGIRDLTVTGVQTCALPICGSSRRRATSPSGSSSSPATASSNGTLPSRSTALSSAISSAPSPRSRSGCSRSEERRVGKSVDLGGRRIIKKKKKKKEKEDSIT